MDIPTVKDHKLDHPAISTLARKTAGGSPLALNGLRVAGAAALALIYALLLSHDLISAFIVLAALVIIYMALQSASNLVAIFPIIYFFTFFQIPGFGSPEKLLGGIILFVFAVKVLMGEHLITMHAGMMLTFVLYIAAHFPALTYSIGSLKNNLAGIISHLSMGVFVYLIVHFIRDQQQIENCVSGMVVLSIIVLVFILFLIVDNHSIGFYRDPNVNRLIKNEQFIRFTFMNSPNRLCRVMLMVYPFVFLFFLYAKSHLQRFLGMLLCVAVPCIVVITFSRMGFITLAIILPILYARYRHRTRLFLFIFVSFIVTATLFSSMIIWRFARLQEQREAYGEVKRYSTWKSGVQGWLEHPIFGVGVSKDAIYKTMDKQGALKLNPDEMIEVAKSPHSIYLNTLLETGVAGFTTLGLLFYLLIRFMKKSLRGYPQQTYLYDFIQLGFISLFSALLMGITANSIWLNIFWFIVGLLYSGARIITANRAGYP